MIKIGVIFGGRSTEAEISVITALTVMQALDRSLFEIVPVFVDPAGKWWTGSALTKRSTYPLQSSQDVTEVTLACEPLAHLTELRHSFFSFGAPRTFEIDVWFPTFHGTFGEDGCMQGLFEIHDLPYVGSGVLSSALGMNKIAAKRVFEKAGIPILPHVEVRREHWNADTPEPTLKKILGTLSLPLIVKPVNLGSSVGLSKATNEEELAIGIAGALAFDPSIMIEPMLHPLYELNCAVREGFPPIPSALERPQAAKDGLLTFQQKYMSGGAKKLSLESQEGMASTPRDVNPVLPAGLAEKVKEFSSRAYTALGCQGIVRVDFLVHAETGELFLNEVNTIPGSLAYYLWDAAEPRVPFTDILTHLIDGAIRRNKVKRANRILPVHSVLQRS